MMTSIGIFCSPSLLEDMPPGSTIGGKIRDMQTGLQSNLHAIYGGVEFGCGPS